MAKFEKLTTEQGREWFINVESIVAFSGNEDGTCTIKLAGSHETIVKESLEKIQALTGVEAEKSKSKVRTSSYHE